VRVELPGIRLWRHDLGGCLHATLGVLVGFHGLEPLHALGSAWEFFYVPGDARREEYYFPCRRDGLVESIAPYHPLRSRWHAPADAEAGWSEVRAAVAAGAPVAVAVDNYFLPFRPAFGDVHTNHLLVVWGFDDDAGVALVADPVPPRMCGPLALESLAAARGSENPIRHERDLFFTGEPIDQRWLEVTLTGKPPPLDRAFLRRALGENLRRFEQGTTAGALCGLEGERAFLERSLDRLAAGEPVVDELFVVAGALLAATGLHADFLALAATCGDWSLLEASRAVDRVAHHWTAFRIAVASSRTELDAVPGLRRRAAALVADHELALDALRAALSRLEADVAVAV
jgi:Butirosin biosynthesis protein H, N-terminal